MAEVVVGAEPLQVVVVPAVFALGGYRLMSIELLGLGRNLLHDDRAERNAQNSLEEYLKQWDLRLLVEQVDENEDQGGHDSNNDCEKEQACVVLNLDQPLQPGEFKMALGVGWLGRQRVLAIWEGLLYQDFHVGADVREHQMIRTLVAQHHTHVGLKCGLNIHPGVVNEFFVYLESQRHLILGGLAHFAQNIVVLR